MKSQMPYESIDTESFNYFIIGGVTKAATTSLFTYLSDHPDFLASTQKECCFWTDKGYSQRRNKYYVPGTNYNDCFPKLENEVFRLDSSPNYLYSKGTPERIKSHSGNFVFYFSLREPISRLVSFYSYSQQLGMLSQETSLTEFVDILFRFKDSDDYQIDRQHRFLIEGNYSHYLKKYKQLFPNSVNVIFYENIKDNPKEVVKSIVQENGLNTDFYDEYDFRSYNKTRVVSNKKLERKYHRLVKGIALKARNSKPLYKIGLGLKNKILQPVFYYFNGGYKRKKVILTPEIENRLIEYYKPDVQILNNQYNLPSAWKERYDL